MMKTENGRVRKIKKLFDYPLRVKGEKVDFYDLLSGTNHTNYKIKQFIDDLKETLMSNDKGIGISAHQIGAPYKIFIAVDEVFVNPEVVSKSEDMIESREGCLSVPNAVRVISRHKEIEISYFSEEGEEKKGFFTGLKAIVIQHELDHLEGILISDNR